MDAIGEANELLRGLGFSHKEAHVAPFEGVAVLRGTLVGNHVASAGNMMRAIRELPSRAGLLELQQSEHTRPDDA